MQDTISIRGARQHNLKNINIDIPRNKLVVFTGLSGSGKSSMAIDTIYAEGQRRYVESLSSYARQFLGVMDKPDMDSIEGLSPAISITQKSSSHNPRSTVGTITEIYDYLRVLYARIGHPHCHQCGEEISHQSVQQIVDQIIALVKKGNMKKGVRLLFLAPLIKDRKGEYSKLFDSLRQRGYYTIRLDNKFQSLHEDFVLIKTNKHTIESEIGRLVIDSDGIKNIKDTRRKLSELTEQSLKLGEGNMILLEVNDSSFEFPEHPTNTNEHLFSERFACPKCNISLAELEPRNFSFNTPHGACPKCDGIGTTLNIDPKLIIAPNLTIPEGGIIPYARMLSQNTWMHRLVERVADLNNIDLDQTLINFSDEELRVILYGTGDELYTIFGEDSYGNERNWTTKYEGIIPNLERRYTETDSDVIRAQLSKFMRLDPCPDCKGKRLKNESLSVTIEDKNISDISDLSIKDLYNWLGEFSQDEQNKLNERETQIASPILKETLTRIKFLVDVGLDYLTLSRSATTLAGGETQRIRLASQIGSGLTGVLYILDEPTIGLHQRDNTRLINTLKKLRDLGNTVVVVEHDQEMIENADFILDFGPGAGEHGGKIVSSGSPKDILKDPKSLTGQYMSGKKNIKPIIDKNNIHLPSTVKKVPKNASLILKGAEEHNLKKIKVSFPLENFICVTGVSGSGKSTLIHDTLYYGLKEYFGQGNIKPGKYSKIEGLKYIDKVILIDQSPIGRTPRSNPATYTGVFNYIRDLFAMTPEAKARGYQAGRFSFNVKGGRCETCQGDGQIKIEMQFMPDVYVNCESCRGKRYNRETLEIHYRNKTIAEVLAMTVEEALDFFEAHPTITKKLRTLNDVGLSYIRLGQPAPTLSGGEAQRIKLAAELSKNQKGHTMYLLDEPTTGLHFADIEKLLTVLKQLVAHKNTVVVIEHNLDVIKNADHIIDLGPEGGDEGGKVVATGTPHEISKISKSYTGQYLKKVLKSK